MPISAPTDISDCVLWLDGSDQVYSDAGTTPAVNNDLVHRWADKSGNANHCNQVSDPDKPTYKTNIINGRAILRFAGSEGFDLVAFTTASDRTVFMVLLFADTTTNFLNPINVGEFAYFYRLSSPAGDVGIGRQGATDECHYASISDVGTTNFHVHTGWVDQTGGTDTEIWLDATSKDTNSSASTGGTVANELPHLGSWPGDMAEVIVYNRALTGPQIADVQNWLGLRYGLFGSVTVPVLYKLYHGATAGSVWELS